jgi:hypothetical protein
MKESILVNLNKVALMAMASLNTMMAHFMRETGKIASCTAKANFSKLRTPLFMKEIS